MEKQDFAKIFIIAAVIAAGLTGAINATYAQNGNLHLFSSNMEMAYAPQQTDNDDRFAQFESDEELHELNDAWLGMPVKSNNGKLIGFVEDAYLDNEGNISELLVSLNGKNFAVYVDGKFASLSDTEVDINLSGSAIASLEREKSTLVSSR